MVDYLEQAKRDFMEKRIVDNFNREQKEIEFLTMDVLEKQLFDLTKKE